MKKNDILFVIIAGDSVYRKTAEQYEYLQRKVAQSQFNRPVFAAIGNEDVVARDDYALFRRYLAGANGTGQNGAIGFFPFGKGYTERFAFTVPPKRPPRRCLSFGITPSECRRKIKSSGSINLWINIAHPYATFFCSATSRS